MDVVSLLVGARENWELFLVQTCRFRRERKKKADDKGRDSLAPSSAKKRTQITLRRSPKTRDIYGNYVLTSKL